MNSSVGSSRKRRDCQTCRDFACERAGEMEKENAGSERPSNERLPYTALIRTPNCVESHLVLRIIVGNATFAHAQNLSRFIDAHLALKDQVEYLEPRLLFRGQCQSSHRGLTYSLTC